MAVRTRLTGHRSAGVPTAALRRSTACL